MPECRSYFSFFYYDSLFDLPSYKSRKFMPADKYIMAQLIAPHHSLKNGSNVSCPLRYFIMSELTCSFQKKYHHTDIQFSRFDQAVIYRPAKIHPTQRYTLADLQIMFLSDYQIQVICSAL